MLAELVSKLSKSEVEVRYKHDTCARVIQEHWRASARAKNTYGLARWQERSAVDFANDRWLRRQLEARVESEDSTGALHARVDYEEAMHQARLLAEMGVGKQETLRRAVEAEVFRARQREEGQHAAAPSASLAAHSA